MAGDAAGFLARWSRRKEQIRSGEVPAPEPVPAQAESPPAPPQDAGSPNIDAHSVEVAAVEPRLGMSDVALLTRESDYSRFLMGGVDEDVKRAAMKKLFTDPHFNVMDGLDTYIDDYGKPDPIPLAMLRQMQQAKFLRLFDDEEGDDPQKSTECVTAATAVEPANRTDDDPPLRLQQDDAVGQPGPDQGAGA